VFHLRLKGDMRVIHYDTSWLRGTLGKTREDIPQYSVVIVLLGAFCASRIIERGLMQGLGIIAMSNGWAQPEKWLYGIQVLRALIHIGFGLIGLGCCGGKRERLACYACVIMIFEWCIQRCRINIE